MRGCKKVSLSEYMECHYISDREEGTNVATQGMAGCVCCLLRFARRQHDPSIKLNDSKFIDLIDALQTLGVPWHWVPGKGMLTC